MTNQTKVIVGLAMFYGLFLGVGIRMFFFPEMPNEHWLYILIMAFFTYNIVAYFNKWALYFMYSEASDSASEASRIIGLLVSATIVVAAIGYWISIGVDG